MGWVWFMVGVLIGAGLVCLLFSALIVGVREDEARARWIEDEMNKHERP